MGLTAQDAISIREKLWQLLGDMPPIITPTAKLLSKTEQETYTKEYFSFSNGLSDTVYGYLLIPYKVPLPAPAILYHHPHGGKYDRGKEAILTKRDNGYADGIALVEAGFIVIAIDAYAFGERQQQGPAGERESGRETEMSLFKHFLWHGRTLWGMMVHDDLLTLAYLRRREEVDVTRIGTTGMSLGASRSTWVGALDSDIKAVIPISQMTRYADFVESGNYRHHSIYYYVPGMLKSGIDMEHIVSLVAPRYQHILSGDSDPLSPMIGIEKIVAYTRDTYQDYDVPDQLDVTIYEGIDHQYTSDMCEAMIRSFQQHL